MATNIKEVKILDANGNPINSATESTLQQLLTWTRDHGRYGDGSYVVKMLDANGNPINSATESTLQELLTWIRDQGRHWDGSYIGINFPHFENHEGSSFLFSYVFNNVSSGAVYNFLVNANGVQPHVISEFNFSTDVTFTLIEGANVTANGTLQPSICKNRPVNKTSNVNIYYNPTFTGGTTLLQYRKGNTGLKSILENRDDGEIILIPNTNYILRITINNNGTSGSFVMNWYEE